MPERGTESTDLLARAERYRLIDALRGLAALWVASYHFYRAGPLHETLAGVTPRLVGVFLAHGDLGVQVFFVISGMVIAYSVGDARVTGGYLGRFGLRRSIRLDPPYWTVIALFVVVRFAAGSGVPSWAQVGANVVYLQNILGQGDLMVVFWTLCLEVQFYIVLVVLLGLVQRIPGARTAPRRQAVVAVPFLLLFGASYLQMVDGPPPRVWFVGYWYLFFLGALTCWSLRGRVPHLVLAATGGLILLASALGGGPEPFVGVLTAALIYVAGVRGRLSTWLDWAPLQYLGRLSYSLYLLHVLTGGTLVAMGWSRWGGGSVLGAVIWFWVGLLVSILTADVLNRVVERPSQRLSRRVRMKKAEAPATGGRG